MRWFSRILFTIRSDNCDRLWLFASQQLLRTRPDGDRCAPWKRPYRGSRGVFHRRVGRGCHQGRPAESIRKCGFFWGLVHFWVPQMKTSLHLVPGLSMFIIWFCWKDMIIPKKMPSQFGHPGLFVQQDALFRGGALQRPGMEGGGRAAQKNLNPMTQRQLATGSKMTILNLRYLKITTRPCSCRNWTNVSKAETPVRFAPANVDHGSMYLKWFGTLQHLFSSRTWAL